ncbi:hypothetical protein BDN72DRAFT_780105, partial [Pluteus cervinus]
MKILEIVLPPSQLEVIEHNSLANNVPFIGYSGNYAFPASQLNVSSAVADEEADGEYWSVVLTIGISDLPTVAGLPGMGEFGQLAGHRDSGDSPGAWTVMISLSRLPMCYSHGRLHIPILGGYAKLKTGRFFGMCGLFKHGCSPPIAPRGQQVSPHACRLAFINY